MNMARNSIQKLRKILSKKVIVKSGVRDALRDWDKFGDDQLELHRIENFNLKITAKTGDKGGKGSPTLEETITQNVVAVKDIGRIVDWVVDQREMDKERTVLRVSIDCGGGSLKVLGNIFHVDEDPEILFTKYEQPGQLHKGVNFIILLAYIEDLQES